MSEKIQTYVARIETDSGTIAFEFDTDETTIGGIMRCATDIAHECIDEAAVFVSGGILKDFQLNKTHL